MTWWNWIWIAAMAVVTVAGAAVDSKDREPAWYTALGVASGAACVVFVLNFFGLLQLGNLFLPALLTLAALVWEAWHDVRSDPELSARQKILSIGLTLALFAPAAALGLVGPAA